MDWLLKKDEYSPPADKDGFIDRNLFALLGTLARIRKSGNPSKGFFYRLNPTLKFIFTFLIILFISLSGKFPFILLADAYILLTLALLEWKDIKKTAVIVFSVSLFTSVLLLPSVLSGNLHNGSMLFMKIIGSVAAINIMAHSSKWSHITRSMRVFRVPDLFILVLDIAIKYIVILGEFSLNTLYALKLRSIGKNDRKHSSVSGQLGGLFLKSKEMAELTYAAMICRGFDGHYVTTRKHHFVAADIIFIPVNVILLLTFYIL